MEMRYISTDISGWLRVKLEPAGNIIPLPQYLKVSYRERKNNRDYFHINEGIYKGKEASVSIKSTTTSWLASPLPNYNEGAHLTFIIKEKKLITPIGSFNAFTDENPIEPGSYPIQIPDFPHSIGEAYTPIASKAISWFYLGVGHAVKNNNDRYLHPGRVSLGCITITDISKWDSLYNYLIKCRTNGGINVGSVTVKNEA